jgi:hypothetical protein
MRPLKVLIANMEMASRTGSVTVARKLALGLPRAGHASAVLTRRVGAIGPGWRHPRSGAGAASCRGGPLSSICCTCR